MAETEARPEEALTREEQDRIGDRERPLTLATRGTPLTQPARFAFDNEQLALMKRTVARGADDNAFLMFLELVGRYKLDPFAGQCYLAKMPGKDGEPPTYRTIISRDGLLAIANRYEDFEGIEGDVIYTGDLIARTADGFVHTYEATAAEERLARPVLGAWARCYRRGRRPTFFLAKLTQYKKSNKVWSTYGDAMILKVPESMTLRKQFSITGLIPEDEVGAHYDERFGGVVASDEAPVSQEPDWGPDEDLARRLQVAFAEANRVRPGSFLPQKIRLQLAGVDQLRRAQILQTVTDFVLANGGSIPIDGEVVDEPGDEAGPAAA